MMFAQATKMALSLNGNKQFYQFLISEIKCKNFQSKTIVYNSIIRKHTNLMTNFIIMFEKPQLYVLYFNNNIIRIFNDNEKIVDTY